MRLSWLELRRKTSRIFITSSKFMPTSPIFVTWFIVPVKNHIVSKNIVYAMSEGLNVANYATVLIVPTSTRIKMKILSNKDVGKGMGLINLWRKNLRNKLIWIWTLTSSWNRK